MGKVHIVPVQILAREIWYNRFIVIDFHSELLCMTW